MGGRWTAFLVAGAGVVAALALLPAAGAGAFAQGLAIAGLEHFTDNRGWNDAGLSPTYQIVVTATVAPSGFPTLVFVEQGGVRQPLVHFPQPSAPNAYVYWRGFDPAFTGSWRIVAERGDARGAPVWTSVLAASRSVEGRACMDDS